MKIKLILFFLLAADSLFVSFSLYATLQEEYHNTASRLIRAQQTIDILPDDIFIIIFSFLNQRDVSSTARTGKRWHRLMNNNQLWERYAKRALLIIDESPSHDRNYKALVKEHCIFSFKDLGTLNVGMASETQDAILDSSAIAADFTFSIPESPLEVFRWTDNNDIKFLGTINVGPYISSQIISSDGSEIIGVAYDGTVQRLCRAFRWTVQKGMEPIGPLKKGPYSSKQNTSFDGSIILSYDDDTLVQSQERAAQREAEKSLESVEKLLIEKSFLPANWILTQVNAITPSGAIFVGDGLYKTKTENGGIEMLYRAWRAVIPKSSLF